MKTIPTESLESATGGWCGYPPPAAYYYERHGFGWGAPPPPAYFRREREWGRAYGYWR